MSTGKILSSLFAGVAAGAVLGILFAPDKGSNTRKKISKSGEDLIDDLKYKFEEFIETAKDKYADIKGDAENIIEKGKSHAIQVNKDIKEHVN